MEIDTFASLDPWKTCVPVPLPSRDRVTALTYVATSRLGQEHFMICGPFTLSVKHD